MLCKRAWLAALICGSVLIPTAAAWAQEGDYRYGQLLVQRGQSTWRRDTVASAAPIPPAVAYRPAPTVIPNYPPPSPPTAPAATPVKEPPSARKPIPSASPPLPPSDPKMGAYYMPVPPASSEEPALAPGDALPATPTDAAIAAYAATPAPDLQSKPLVPEVVTAQDTNSYMLRLPSGALMSSDGTAIGGVLGPEHPGRVVQTEEGMGFRGPVAADPGYLPSWLNLYLGNGYRRDKVETKRYAQDLEGSRRIVKEEWSPKEYEVKGGVSFTNRSGFLNGLHVQAEGSYGMALSGDVEEEVAVTHPPTATEPASTTVVTSNDRQDNDSSASHWSAAMGYEFSPDFIVRRKAHTSIIPLVGYRFAQQKLSGTTALSALDYDLEWKAPFIGLDMGIEWPEYSFGLKTAYYWAGYEGSGAYQDLESSRNIYRFAEDADAQGFGIGGNFRANVYHGLEIFLDVAMDFWSTDDGVTSFTPSTSELATPVLDEVSWQSQSYQLGVSYRW